MRRQTADPTKRDQGARAFGEGGLRNIRGGGPEAGMLSGRHVPW
jgi:hypothetical protein